MVTEERIKQEHGHVELEGIPAVAASPPSSMKRLNYFADTIEDTGRICFRMQVSIKQEHKNYITNINLVDILSHKALSQHKYVNLSSRMQ